MAATAGTRKSIFQAVDFKSRDNNLRHHTDEISLVQLIVRRGQPFNLTLTLTQAFKLDPKAPLVITAMTGKHAEENRGTLSIFGIPDNVKRSPAAKAVWKVDASKTSNLAKGILDLILLPPADAPIGEYNLTIRYNKEETLLATLTVLFNPWCKDDSVYMEDKAERDEYVMNENGVIFKGSLNYIYSKQWDYGQFGDRMVDACLKMLDLNPKHKKDPADDVSARCNPIYVSRVISAMVNSDDDRGIVQGKWGAPYVGGKAPFCWSGSHEIFMAWMDNDYQPVKYGRCWVFAAVMCSAMRLLGIPCRVVTNIMSAHDVDRDLTVDIFYNADGMEETYTVDKVWNFHVWTEGWMRRPDLPGGGKYDGWQVLDPTPQLKSDGVHCCGPTPVKAVLNGETDLKYDVPFVYAEVNADCIDWLVHPDGKDVEFVSDIKKVGKFISTKAVGSKERVDITHTYKYKDGSEKDREVRRYALTKDYSTKGEYDVLVSDDDDEEPEPEAQPKPKPKPKPVQDQKEDQKPKPKRKPNPDCKPGSKPERIPLTMRFEEVTEPKKGRMVKLNLVLHTEGTVNRDLSINISAHALNQKGQPTGVIMNCVRNVLLLPKKEMSVPVYIKFSEYGAAMLESESMKVLAIATDKLQPKQAFLAELNIVLLDPPIAVTVIGEPQVGELSNGQVVFKNPVQQKLKGCTLGLSGGGIFREKREYKLPSLDPNTRITIKFPFVPYKPGVKTIMVDLDCDTFKDIWGHRSFTVKPSATQ